MSAKVTPEIDFSDDQCTGHREEKMTCEGTANPDGGLGIITARLLCAPKPVDSRSPIAVYRQLP
jgi:hypothetical protein